MVNESLTTALAVALRPCACHGIDPGPHGECVEGSGRAGSARASGRGRRRELKAGGPFRSVLCSAGPRSGVPALLRVTIAIPPSAPMTRTAHEEPMKLGRL